MKNLYLVIAILVYSFNINAQEIKDKNAKYTVEVNGNCNQCKKRIEKTAYSISGVKFASWNVETHQLNLIINQEKTSIDKVSAAILKAGHDVEKSKATQTDYDNLHACCKYERKP